MKYTVLFRSGRTQEILAKRWTDVGSLDANITVYFTHPVRRAHTPLVWAEGFPDVGNVDDQDIREKACAEWLADGRTIIQAGDKYAAQPSRSRQAFVETLNETKARVHKETRYTFLLRDQYDEIWRAKGEGSCAQEALDSIIRGMRSNHIPFAWCHGMISSLEFGHFGEKNKRNDVAKEWVRQGRAIACFTQEDGNRRYVVQLPKDATDERAQLKTYTNAAPVKADPVIDVSVTSMQQYMEALLGGTVEQPVVSNAKPPLVGLLRCSTDARERDHLVQTRFGTAW